MTFRHYSSLAGLYQITCIVFTLAWFFVHTITLATGASHVPKQKLLLQALLSPSAQCKRDGEWQEIEARELVPGDLIQLKGGDVIPADAKVKANPKPVPQGTSKDLSDAMCDLQSAPHGDKHCPNTTVLSGCLPFMISIGVCSWYRQLCI